MKSEQELTRINIDYIGRPLLYKKMVFLKVNRKNIP